MASQRKTRARSLRYKLHDREKVGLGEIDIIGLKAEKRTNSMEMIYIRM